MKFDELLTDSSIRIADVAGFVSTEPGSIRLRLKLVRENQEQAVDILLADVRESSIQVEQANPETGLNFRISHGDDPLLWNYAATSSIFGTAPLPDPPRFFHEFYTLVRFELGVDRDPARYLNWKDKISEWTEFAYSHAYCLLSAPDPIVEACRELLDVQAAEYTVLPNPFEPPAKRPCIVRWRDSWVICSEIDVIP